MKNGILSIAIKTLIAIVVIGFLILTLNGSENLGEGYLALLKERFYKSPYLFLLVLLLMPLNIGLEAIKWRYLIERLEKLSFKTAFASVLAGNSLAFVTPHGIGDYVARIITLTSTERLKGIGAVFLSRISQFYITLYFGSIALVYYVYMVIQAVEPNYVVLIWFTVANNVLFILLFIYHKSVLTTLGSIRILKKLLPYIEILKSYSFREINYVLLLSFFRYCIFSFQFVLMLVFFDIYLPILIIVVGVFFVFFIKSVIPTFLDLGVRETAAIMFFGVYSENHSGIIFAALTLWLINVVFPAMLGLFTIMKMNFFKRKPL